MGTGTAPPVEFLTSTRLGEKGQLTIPKEYRRSLALEAGAPIAVLQVGSGLLLIPEQARFRELCDRITRVFSSHGLTTADVVSTLPDSRKIVFARLYPRLSKRQRASRSRESRASRG